jgi:hypothetical protein
MTNRKEKESLDQSIIKALNPVFVLNFFATHYEVTIFLNKFFNNYGLYNLKSEEFYKYLKQLVNDKNISPYSFSFIKYHPQEKKISSMRKFFPYLKREDIILLLDLMEKEDENDKQSFLETVGDLEVKKKKIPKQTRKARK